MGVAVPATVTAPPAMWLLAIEVMRTSWTVVVVAHAVVVVADVVVLPPPGNVMGSVIGDPLVVVVAAVVVVPAVVVVAAVVVVPPGNVMGSVIGRPLVVVVAAVVVVEPVVVVEWDVVVDPSVVVAPVVAVHAPDTDEGAAELADAARTASTLPPMARGRARPATRLTVSAVSMCVPSPSKSKTSVGRTPDVSVVAQTWSVRLPLNV